MSGTFCMRVLGMLAIITTVTAVGPCPEENNWCSTVDGVCDSERTKHLCPRTCNTCLPEICSDCEQNCSTSHEGKEYQCTCNRGYRINDDLMTCSDVNECKVTPDICGGDLVCKNRVGDYECLQDECKIFQLRGYIRSYSYPEKCCKMNTGKCGQNNQNSSPRAVKIVGGVDASSGMWPWHAMIEMPSGFCGGALISDRWIVTSAQCLRSIPNRIRVSINIRVTFGTVERNNPSSNTRQVRTITQVFKHFKFRFPQHDIAVARLNRPIKTSEFVRPICLPNGEIPKDGTRCFATGFGVTNPKEFTPADVLHQVDLPIFNIMSCRDKYKGSGRSIHTTAMICAGGGESGKDTCIGDSGGPLVCQRCDSCDWFLAGVTSFGSGCGSSDRPGVYTNLKYHEKWIASTTKAVKVVKKTCTPVKWSRWGGWTSCTKSCGGGFESRIRICSDSSAKGLPGCLGNWFDKRTCNTLPCGIGSWSKWTECSKSCGGGKQTRTTKCEKDGCNRLSETRDCNKKNCPRWNRWSQWSECTQSCGGGSRTRTRTCENGRNDECGSQSSMTRSCGEVPCPSWGSWSKWQKCSDECGGGTQSSTRRCIGGTVGVDCKGQDRRSKECNIHACKFSSWGKWTRCSATCDPGTQERLRRCPKGSCQSDEFGLAIKDTRSCNIANCVGEWSDWTPWNECSQSCGGGISKRTRSCANGLICLGELSTQEVRCNSVPCFGVWTKWSAWSKCQATCGEGRAIRSRSCVEGPDCPGSSQESRSCSIKPCATWSDWSSWSACNPTCGDAIQARRRVCQQGDDCLGRGMETRECLTVECPSWTQWSLWSPCGATCGEGFRERQRFCVNGPGCSGKAKETDKCTEKSCAAWSDWSLWSSCDATCGDGFTKRQRTCQNGPGCTGEREESQTCNFKLCPTWSIWSEWSSCDTSCGKGNRARTRSCENGMDCLGLPQETEECQLKLCPAWSNWSGWTPCSKTCGGGNTARNRTCENSSNGDEECEGDNKEEKSCAIEVCPSQCSFLCISRVKQGACVLQPDWMVSLCHSDCCGPATCRDEIPQCKGALAAGYCRDPNVGSRCLAECGYCPQ